MALFLRLGAALDQRRTQEVDRAGSRQDRGAGAEILLVENHLLHKAGAAPAIFLGPGNPDPAGGVHLFLPGDALFQSLAVGGDALVGGIVDFDFLGEIVVKPLPELGAESGMLRAVGEIHVRSHAAGSGSNPEDFKRPELHQGKRKTSKSRFENKSQTRWA